jgi:hypothetical protein
MCLQNPSPLGKRHTLVIVTWPINYWIIDKDTYVKVSPTHVKSVALPCNIDNTNNNSDSVAHWLPTATKLTIMDTSRPNPLVKLPIFIEQDSMQYHMSESIDSITTLNFASRDFSKQNKV